MGLYKGELHFMVLQTIRRDCAEESPHFMVSEAIKRAYIPEQILTMRGVLRSSPSLPDHPPTQLHRLSLIKLRASYHIKHG